jgi:hypothetical protein
MEKLNKTTESKGRTHHIPVNSINIFLKFKTKELRDKYFNEMFNEDGEKSQFILKILKELVNVGKVEIITR